MELVSHGLPVFALTMVGDPALLLTEGLPRCVYWVRVVVEHIIPLWDACGT